MREWSGGKLWLYICLPSEAVPPADFTCRHRVARRPRHAVPAPAKAHGAAGEAEEDERDEDEPEACMASQCTFEQGVTR